MRRGRLWPKGLHCLPCVLSSERNGTEPRVSVAYKFRQLLPVVTICKLLESYASQECFLNGLRFRL